MPIYEYECEACGHKMEKLQKMSDEPLIDCPECGKPKLRKLISAAGFRLSGGGWYETDFKSGNKRNLVDKSPDAPKKSADKSTKSTEKKKSTTKS
ncbi:MAG: zinc ribbon domain-containing protein [Thiothrix sp.]|nr:MAG: zinc ribbon domain-containing protein [Thiothrix sp.]